MQSTCRTDKLNTKCDSKIENNFWDALIWRRILILLSKFHFTLHKLPQSTCYISNENLIFLLIHAVNERYSHFVITKWYWYLLVTCIIRKTESYYVAAILFVKIMFKIDKYPITYGRV